MTTQSARSMAWASILMLMVGGMVIAPEAGVAALCSLLAVLYGTRVVRYVALLLLFASLGLLLALLPGAIEQMGRYQYG
jgi:hypothetical protein